MSTKRSTILANAAASPPVMNDTPMSGAEVRSQVCVVDVATTDIDASDIIELCKLPADAIIYDIQRTNEDLGTTLTAHLGLYDKDGNVKDADSYASSLALGTAQATFTSDRFESGAEGGDPTKFGQKVYEDAGDTDNSGGEYILALTVTVSSTPAAGRINYLVTYGDV